jgi:3-hydroxyacyl-[acyl-carrier-protein] dehydratase
MREAAQTQLAGHGFELGQGAGISQGEDSIVRDVLRRCSPETRLAAREFRRTGCVDHLPAIIDGVIEHYADPDVRAKLKGGDGTLRLVEDLAIDSLTLLEIIFIAEEVLGITIDNDEVRPFRTVDDVRGFIIAKVQAAREREMPRAPAGSR